MFTCKPDSEDKLKYSKDNAGGAASAGDDANIMLMAFPMQSRLFAALTGTTGGKQLAPPLRNARPGVQFN